MKRFYLLIFLLSITHFLNAQAPVKNKVLKYSLKDGLSFGIVNSITQDENGFMWFATSDGLNRFDGSVFKVFKTTGGDSTGLAGNYVQKILNDHSGNIWVSSRNGLSKLDIRTEKFSHYRLGNDNAIKNDIDNIIQSSNGNIWIASYGLGFSYLQIKNSGFINYNQKNLPQLSSNRIVSLFEDSKGLLWVGTQDAGIDIFHQKNGRVTDKANTVTRLDDKALGRVNQIFEDHLHHIWIATASGLLYYDRQLNSFSRFQTQQKQIRGNNYLSLNEDNRNNLLIGLQDGGLYKLNLPAFIQNKKKFTLTPVVGDDGYNMTQRSVQTIYLDKQQNIWVGTYGEGVYMISNISEKFTRLQKIHEDVTGKSLMRFYGMCQDKTGNLWFGTDGDGIFKTAPDGTMLKHYYADGHAGSLTNNAILYGYRDRDDNLWFGTYAKGLFKYDANSDSFINYSHKPNDNKSLGANDVRVIYQDKHKNLWVGTNGGGLSLFDPVAKTFTNYNPSNSAISSYDVRAIAEDAKGNLFIGTYGGGLNYLNIEHKKFTRFFNPAEEKRFMPGQVVFALYLDAGNKLWIGTEGDGLIIYDHSKKNFQYFNEKNKLANNTIYTIQSADNKSVWVSTNKGLSNIDIGKNSVSNFDQSDGLQAGQFNVGSVIYDTRNHAMYFGGTEGLNVFNPDGVNKSYFKPKVIITGLQIFGNQVEVGDHGHSVPILSQVLNETRQLVLQPDQAVFSIQYTSLNYTHPQKGQFAYKLDGLDKTWNYVGNQRSATYRYLAPGDYTFRVKCANQDGVWFNDYATLQIKILPPWYKTWWAYFCYIAVVGLLIYYFVRYRINQSRLKYEIRLTQLSAEKDKELNERKLSFFTNISHEFRTPLTLIINPVKDMLFGKTGHDNDPGNLHIVYRNARRLLSLVDQLLLFRKAESDTDKLKIVRLNIVALCREVFLCFHHQAKTKHIQFDFLSEKETIEIFADREKMEIALFNLVSNALKFTPEHGAVSLTIIEQEDQVSIEIKDSGCGIAEGIGDQLFNKFYQLQNTSTFAGGFGIGLYLVKVFIESHKGNISYTSRHGQGTVFNILLQKGKDHFGEQFVFEDAVEASVFLDELVENKGELPTDEIETNTTTKSTEALSSDTKTMLLIDDNQQIRAYLKRIFSDDFEIFEADNGTDGLELVYHLVPDIVISDVMMHGLSGIELCSRIKEDPLLNHIPVILLTASTSPEIKLKGIEGGADDYISKPFEKEILIARVNGILKSRNNLQKYFYNEITLNKSNDLKISPEYKEFLEKCLKIVEQHLTDSEFNIKALAAEIGMSHSNLYKRIKSISGQSANGFIRFIRLRKAAEILLTTDNTVYETASMVGINDLKYFREQFHKLFGINPSDYIKKYRKPFHNNYNINRDMVKDN